MPKSAKRSKTQWFLLWVLLPVLADAGEFAARIENVRVQKEGVDYVLHAHIRYQLSPQAKEAIYKGVPLSWVLLIKLQRQFGIWYKTLDEQRIPFVIQYQALLNQYSVNNLRSDQVEMFSTLNTALNYMAAIREPILPGIELSRDENYRVAVKIQFDREFLPIPLRPESYFDSQWSLSSDWLTWHLQK